MNPIPTGLAASYLAAGLSCLPAVRAQKRPAVGSWRTWAERLPTVVEVEAWFANRPDAVCIVAGAVSGNLECIDFDNKGELFEAWKGKVAPDLYSRLVVERTPSGGFHVIFRAQTDCISGNLKLARGDRGGKLATLIETRGEGGLFLCCPTDGYSLTQGEFAHIPLLTADERDALIEAARSLDELKDAPQGPLTASGEFSRNHAGRPDGGHTGPLSAFLARPGDDFASRGDPRPYLTASGWQLIGSRPDGNELWRRPGKTSGGHSATYDGSVFYVFSSNAAPFESERGYNAFQVYTLLEHRGDFTEAARVLLEKGYGKAEDPLQGVDLSEFGTHESGSAPAAAPQQVAEPEDIPVSELVANYPKMRPVLIHGFLRLGETMNIIAPPKTGKSWLVTDLALSVATGTPWFGFPCEAGRVLIIDNELHRETSASRIPKVIAARGFDVSAVGDRISVYNQRGRLRTIEDIGTHIERYRGQGYKLIIIDAFYRAMPRGTDENDNGAIADVYNLLDRYAHEIGCAFVLIHHTSKGNQSLKSVTDVGAGAGAQSRAADTHLVLRRHKEANAVVMEAVVRSFPSVPPLCLRWDWPLWNRDESLNPGDLDGKVEPSVRKSGAEQACETDLILSKVRSLVDPENPVPRTAFVRKLQATYGLSMARARLVLQEAFDCGYLKTERLPGLPREKNPTKFVLLGENEPEMPGTPDEEETEQEGDEDD